MLEEMRQLDRYILMYLHVDFTENLFCGQFTQYKSDVKIQP